MQVRGAGLRLLAASIALLGVTATSAFAEETQGFKVSDFMGYCTGGNCCDLDGMCYSGCNGSSGYHVWPIDMTCTSVVP
jgi:hypothetical protein